jgi:hypothetical protein
VSETAATELLHLLVDNRFNWEHWQTAKRILRDLVDRSEPICVGGRLGLARTGVTGTQPVSSGEIEAALRRYREGWQLLLQPETRTQFEASKSIDKDLIRSSVAREYDNWVDQFDDFDRFVQEHIPQLRDLVPSRGDPSDLHEHMVAIIKDVIDRARHVSPPLPSTRLDGFIRVHALLQLRALRAKNAYNPVADRHDTFDHDLLRDLALPAAICTSDRGIHNDLEAARSWQRDLVLFPEQLAERNVIRYLKNFDWARAAQLAP